MVELFENIEPDLVKGRIKVFLLNFIDLSHPILQEIGRLRAETFGQIGAGTDKPVDLDDNDTKYTHIVVIDEVDIIGSYRVSVMDNLIKDGKLISHVNNYYELDETFYSQSNQLMELGRSFIQRKYWSGNYLDYLWYGIGLYVKRNPTIKYMYGSISVGNNYSDTAKNYMKAYVEKWYACYDGSVKPRYEFKEIKEDYEYFKSQLVNTEPKKDLKLLNKKLEEMGFNVPPLLKKYLNITEEGGARIMATGYEPTFKASSFFILLKIDALKDLYKDRYFLFLK